MKKYTIQFIGIALTILGFISLYNVYGELVQTTEITMEVFGNIFLGLVLSSIAIYGGIQLFGLQEVGRKLAIIWFSWVLFVVVTTKLPSYLSGESPFLVTPKSKYLILIMGTYLFYAIALIPLLNNKVTDLMSENDDRMRRVGKILSFFLPGLGRALTGNMLLGLGLGVCYVLIMKNLLSQQSFTSILIPGFLAWEILFFIDFAAVKKTFESKQIERTVTESGSEKNSG